MRKIEEIKADYDHCCNHCEHERSCLGMLSDCTKEKHIAGYYEELLQVIIDGISLDRLITICDAERGSRLEEVVRCGSCARATRRTVVGNGITESPYIYLYECGISHLGMQQNDFCSYGQKLER